MGEKSGRIQFKNQTEINEKSIENVPKIIVKRNVVRGGSFREGEIARGGSAVFAYAFSWKITPRRKSPGSETGCVCVCSNL